MVGGYENGLKFTQRYKKGTLPVGLFFFLFKLFLSNVTTGYQCLKFSLGCRVSLFGDIWYDYDIRVINPEFSQECCHLPLLHIQLVISVGKDEYSKFTAFVLFSGG